MKRDIPLGAQWRLLVDVTTVVWLVVFALSLAPGSPLDSRIANRIGIGLLGIFVADLGVTYWRAGETPVSFVRHHWFDVLLVIPYFRVLRMLRILRFLRLLRSARILRLWKIVLSSVRASKKLGRTLEMVPTLIGKPRLTKRRKD